MMMSSYQPKGTNCCEYVNQLISMALWRRETAYYTDLDHEDVYGMSYGHVVSVNLLQGAVLSEDLVVGTEEEEGVEFA